MVKLIIIGYILLQKEKLTEKDSNLFFHQPCKLTNKINNQIVQAKTQKVKFYLHYNMSKVHKVIKSHLKTAITLL